MNIKRHSPLDESPGLAIIPSSRVTLKGAVGDSAIIRETFSMPPRDSELIDQLRQRIAVQGVILNRSEILRAGLAALSALPDALLANAANRVPKMKTGRPKK
jgi:hypothetical protein